MNVSQNFADAQADDDLDPIMLLRSIVEQHGAEMVASFYDTMLQDDAAKQFLDHSVVHGRLSSSMLNWLTQLLSDADIKTSSELQEQQRVVGKVHARIKIPIHLVIEGAIQIKQNIVERLLDQQIVGRTALIVARVASERIDRAMMLMSQSYVNDTKASARSDEAYRLFSLDQDLVVEKEVQRASLMDWSQKTLFSMLRKTEKEGLSRLKHSEFGFWIRHRANFMFQHSTAFQDLLSEMETIDSYLLPQLELSDNTTGLMPLLSDFQVAVDRITFLVSELFQNLAAMENSRDPLTRALNRRFLGSILGREVSFANQNRLPLTILLIDIDYFKAINDQYGHQGGDNVLRQVAQIILDNVRPSDFVFRYGGEEFLVILAETTGEEAFIMAERMRSVLSSRTFEIGAPTAINVTASIGIAQHNGHPDQSYFIKAADEALYKAKADGRDRVFIAPSMLG